MIQEAVVRHVRGEYDATLRLLESAYHLSSDCDQSGFVVALACLSAYYKAARVPDQRCIDFPDLQNETTRGVWRERWDDVEPKIRDGHTRLSCQIIFNLLHELGTARALAMQLRSDERLEEPGSLLPSMDTVLDLAAQVGLPGVDVIVYGYTAQLVGFAGQTEFSISALSEIAEACENGSDHLSAGWARLAAADVLFCDSKLGLPTLFGYAVDHYPFANDTNLIITDSDRFDRTGLDTQRIRNFVQYAISDYAKIGAERGIGLCKLRLAYLQSINSDLAGARQSYAEADQHFANTGDLLHQQVAFAGRILCAWRDGTPALTLDEAADAIAHQAVSGGAKAWALGLGLALTDAMDEALSSRGDVESALRLSAVPRTIFRSLELPLRLARVHMTRASAYASIEVHNEALLEIRSAMDQCKKGKGTTCNETDYARHAAICIAEGLAQVLISGADAEQLEESVDTIDDLLGDLPRPSQDSFEAALATQGLGAAAAVALAQPGNANAQDHIAALNLADENASVVDAGVLHMRAEWIKTLCVVNAAYSRGGAAMEAAEYGKAARHFERALRSADASPDADFQKAMIYARWRRYKEAAAALDKYVDDGMPAGSELEQMLSSALQMRGTVPRIRSVARLYASIEAWTSARDMYRRAGIALRVESDTNEDFSVSGILDSVSLGGIAFALSDTDGALRHFEAAARRIEARRQLFGREQFRRQFSGQRIIHRVYGEWADLHARQGNWAEALRVAELGRARVLAETLEATRAMSDLPQYRVYIEQLAKIERLTSLASTLRRESANDDRSVRLHHERMEAIGVLAKYEAELVTAAPRFRATRSLPDFDALRRALRPGTLLLAYHFFGESLLCWAVSSEGVIASNRVSRIGKTPFFARAFAARCQEWTRGLAEDRVDEVFRAELSEALIGKFESAIQDSSRLVVLPYAELSMLPFNSLTWHGDLLGLQRPISYVPAMSLITRKSTRSVEPADAFVLGDPTDMRFSFTDTGEEQLESLPGSRLEALAVADLYGMRPALDRDNTEPKVRASFDKKPAVVHLATHGCLQPGSPLDSGICLADGDSITVDEFMGVDLPCEVVVLSACDSGRGQLDGSELLGLSRGLMIAGASAIVASLWPVADVATLFLMQTFHRNLISGQDVARALHLAQTAIVDLTVVEALSEIDRLKSLVDRDDSASLASLLWCKADIFSYGGDERTAEKLYSEASEAYRQAGRPDDAMRALREADKSQSLSAQFACLKEGQKMFKSEADWAAFSVVCAAQ
jgi:CHAT domain-containing protein/tetratricopeptide (TPR) repeat protein